MKWLIIAFSFLFAISVNVSSEEMYVVKKGDTLWDISNSFLGYFYQWGVVNSVSINLHGNHFFFNLLSHRILRCFEIIIHLET